MAVEEWVGEKYSRSRKVMCRGGVWRKGLKKKVREVGDNRRGNEIEVERGGGSWRS